jgi:tetratricopeptide (TPR) repeat protein
MSVSEHLGRWCWVLLLAVVTGVLLWSGWRWWEVRRYRRALAEIEEEIENGRHATAARKLTDLLAWQPDSDEALCLLGKCEMARGRSQAADEAWVRVPPGSRFAPQAILGRMQLQMERGRLAEAEQIIRDALDDARVDKSSLPILLGPIYCQQGRLGETLRLIEVRWDALNRVGEGASEAAINLARAHIDLRQSPIPVEVIRSALDQAAELASDDDRTWLGKANLAIRMGSYDEAARWLEACLLRRPEDRPVWRARLDWATATNRVAEAQEALRHLAAGESTQAQIHKLAAWFAAQRGNVESERRALERLIVADPTDFLALERLAALAAKSGQRDRSVELRHRKTEIEKLMARYQQLHRRHQPNRDAAEMARLAEQLGQLFEARAFLTVAVAIDPGRDDLRRDLARLDQHISAIESRGRTLADIPASDLDDVPNPSGQSTLGPVNVGL